MLLPDRRVYTLTSMKKALTYWLALNLAFLPVVGAYAEYAASCRSDSKAEEILATADCMHMSSTTPNKQAQTDDILFHRCCDNADQERHQCLSQCGCDYHAVSMLSHTVTTGTMILKSVFMSAAESPLVSRPPALLFEPPRV